MVDLVLDASVASSWCFPGDPTENTPYSRYVLAELAVRDAVVPAVWAGNARAKLESRRV